VRVGKLAISGLALVASLAFWPGACGAPGSRALIRDGADLRAVVVEGVRIDPSGEPVVTLMEKGGELRRLPIWIGRDQAESIHVALSEIDLPRPNTHDLMVGMLGGLKHKLERVAITDLREGTYYAVIVLSGANGGVQLDARPSDAIALAVRTGASVFVDDRVLANGTPGGDAEDALDIDWRHDSTAPELPRDIGHHSRGWLGL
jgi:hypothetical protein